MIYRLLQSHGTMPKSHFVGKTVDDVIHDVIEEITTRGSMSFLPRVVQGDPTKSQASYLKSRTQEPVSVGPKPGEDFSAGENFCWYYGQQEGRFHFLLHKQICEELAEDGEIFGGYGPRLLNWKGVNQLSLELLRFPSLSDQHPEKL